jgi:gamma-aminobutyric acid receptor subunit alpha
MSHSIIFKQFAFVHTYTKFGFGEIYFNNDETNEEYPKAPPSSPAVPQNKQVERKEERQLVFSIDNNHLLNQPYQPVNETAVVVQPTPGDTPVKTFRKKSSSRQPNWGNREMNSVSKIDKISRVLFPLLFITINFIYW